MPLFPARGCCHERLYTSSFLCVTTRAYLLARCDDVFPDRASEHNDAFVACGERRTCVLHSCSRLTLDTHAGAAAQSRVFCGKGWGFGLLMLEYQVQMVQKGGVAPGYLRSLCRREWALEQSCGNDIYCPALFVAAFFWDGILEVGRRGWPTALVGQGKSRHTHAHIHTYHIYQYTNMPTLEGEKEVLRMQSREENSCDPCFLLTAFSLFLVVGF